MEVDVRIKIELPDEIADMLDIDENSILEAHYDDGHIYIRKVSEDELDELAHEDDDCADCENCEMFCPHCQSCMLGEE